MFNECFMQRLITLIPRCALFGGLIRPRSLRWMSFGDGRLGRRKPIDLADELPAHHKTVWFIRIWSLKQLLHSRSTYRRVNMLSMCAAFISGWKADFFFYHGLIPIVNNLISILHLENPTRVYMWIICTGKFLLTGCLKFKSSQGKHSIWGVFYFIRKRKSKSLVKFFLVW